MLKIKEVLNIKPLSVEEYLAILRKDAADKSKTWIKSSE